MVNTNYKITLVLIVTPNVKLVKPPPITVSPVTDTESELHLVTAQMVCSKTITELVLLVIQNVKLVPETELTVLSVLKTEIHMLQPVLVLMDNMKPTNNVTTVPTNVPHVEITPKTVPNVLMIPDHQNQIVTVLSEDIITEPTLYVHSVTKNVLNVISTLLTVPDVTPPEKPILIHLVHVNLGNTLMLITIVKTVLSDV
jgi:hypothetical protein